MLLEMSQILNTGLDAQSLALCIQLCESGVNPEALARLIKELRSRQASNLMKKTHLSALSIGNHPGQLPGYTGLCFHLEGHSKRYELGIKPKQERCNSSQYQSSS